MQRQNDVRSDDGSNSETDAHMRQFLGYNLKRAYLVVRRNAAAGLQKYGLKIRSFSALSIIVSNPGITPSRLADLLQVERSNIVLILDELETAELVSRDRDPHDRRRFALSATIRGRHILEKATAASAEMDRRAASSLSEKELELLTSLLRRVEEGAES